MAYNDDDLSWMLLPDKSDSAWQTGFEKYIENKFEGTYPGETAPCPCCRCRCMAYLTKDDMIKHLLTRGFDPDYQIKRMEQVRAPEPAVIVDDDNDDGGSATNLLSSLISGAVNGEISESNTEEPNESAKAFFKLMEEARKELYPGCKEATKISFIVRIFQIKCMFGISNNAMEQILHLICMLLPEGHCVPNTLDKIRKVVRDLGLDYQKIHACVNDCVLFRGVHEKADKCPTCGESRWKNTDPDGVGEGTGTTYGGVIKKKKLFPRKILRYFPLIPRLRRLYMNEKTSTDMRWHNSEELGKDGKLRHPANSLAWKHVNDKNPAFAHDPRNVRLGLASDGFNPFGMLNVAYTTWPVILIPYNLPPWLCLKQSYWMMSMLVPGPRSPGMSIDVYLQPLIDELKELWINGVATWDAKEKKNFTLRAVLLWTINDFPAYAMLSGWSTKGKFACPYCNKDTDYLWLKHGKKHCYLGHRRFLAPNHKWRRNKVSFNNTVERREAPVPPNGVQVLEQYQSFEQEKFGKTTLGKRKQRDEDLRWHNWRKKSIFFELPYWETLLIRHNLDVMHIEKNICESLLGTLLGLAGKSKDNEKARLDLQELGIRNDQHPVLQKGKYTLPVALYTLGKNEKEILCKFLQDVKMPDGYAANIRRCVDVDACKVSGLKSHDYHIILQKLLPLVIRHILPEDVAAPLIELSRFFSSVCSKELDVDEIKKLDESIGQTLSRLEMIFPPAFFDIMIHLPVHIAWEARIGGPVCYRWMYPVERYLRTLKSYVRNKACPEGSIAEGYISEECMTFCSRFFEYVSTKINRPERQEKSIVNEPPSGLSVFGTMDYSKNKFHMRTASPLELHRMRHYIITNCDEAMPWINEHLELLAKLNTRNVPKKHKENFVSWFERQIRGLHAQGKVDDMLYTISRTPDHRVRVSNRCFINGFFFRTRNVEKNLSTQNSGVVVKGEGMDWYGLIKNIITLDFPNAKEVMLFECDWFDVPGAATNKSRGYSKDKYGIVDIDTTRFRFSDEPYILATQAEQVCYVKHAKKTNWCTVLRMKPRNLFAMPEGEDTENQVVDTDVGSIVLGVEQMNVEQPDVDLTNWSRNDVEGLSVDASVIEEARAAAMPEPDDIPDEDYDCDDTYTADGVVPPSEEDDSDDFWV